MQIPNSQDNDGERAPSAPLSIEDQLRVIMEANPAFDPRIGQLHEIYRRNKCPELMGRIWATWPYSLGFSAFCEYLRFSDRGNRISFNGLQDERAQRAFRIYQNLGLVTIEDDSIQFTQKARDVYFYRTLIVCVDTIYREMEDLPPSKFSPLEPQDEGLLMDEIQRLFQK